MCGHNDTVKIIILNIATINRDVKMLQLYRISLVFFIRYITCLCIVNTMYHYISTVQADLALSKSFTFLFSTLKNTAACQPEIRIGPCVGQVCGFLYLFIRKLHARDFTHAMHDVPETKTSPRNKAVWTSSRVVRRFYHFYAYLRLDYKALGRSVYAGYS